MKVTPTLEGGLRIDIESSKDWEVLDAIPVDALEKERPSLPEKLSALMDEESGWEDFVVPELATLFSGQLEQVTIAIKQARTEGDPETGRLFIARQDASAWYGALNQARLCLENRFHFGPTEDIEIAGLIHFPTPKRTAFIRSQFYCTLQGVLLEYAMD